MNTPTQQAKSNYKKQNGVFYTSGKVVDILCNWAIRSIDDTVLEPSFGGCGFLEASKRRLETLNCTAPVCNLYGCDVDALAFDHLIKLFGEVETEDRFLKADFLGVMPSDFARPAFRVVVGNPPYVAHHNMAPQQKKSAFALGDTVGLKNRKASLWAYFVRHSMNFLEPGGRLAYILPGSLLHAEYGAEIRHALRYYFRRSVAIQIGERLFLEAGTEEQTIILLGDDFCPATEQREQGFGFAEDLATLADIIERWHAGKWQGCDPTIRPNRALLNAGSEVYEKFINATYCRPLGDFCTFRIGLVTGANRFFILSNDEAKSAQIETHVLTFTLSKFTDAHSLQLTHQDQQNIQNNNKRCLLVDTSCLTTIEGSLKLYLDRFPPEEKVHNKTFAKRQKGELWHRPNDGSVPDAFFPYMQKDGPALLLNASASTCTNAIHRVYFGGSIDEVQKMTIAISILSTFSQLSAEIEGRTYGSGVLKHEPSEAARIRLLLPSNGTNETLVRETFHKIDALLRIGATFEARMAADTFVLDRLPENERVGTVALLNSSLMEARSRRQFRESGTDTKANKLR